MKKLIALSIVAAYLSPAFATQETEFTAQCYVSFSPNGGALAEIVNRINLAEKEVLLQAYNYTSVEIADALISAHRRGVKVSVTVDGKQVKGNGNKLQYTKDSGIEVYLDKKHVITHDKVIVVDDTWTHTGSFNFSNNAEKRNSENSVWCKSKKMAEVYKKHLAEHRAHSIKF